MCLSSHNSQVRPPMAGSLSQTLADLAARAFGSFRSVPVRNCGDPIAADPPGGWGLGKPDRTVWPTARRSVAGTPVPTYDDGFPKAPPPPPALSAVLKVGSRARVARLSFAAGRDCVPPTFLRHAGLRSAVDRRYSTRVLRCTTPRPERRVEGVRDGWALGNPSSYVGTGVPLTDMQADG